MSTAENELVQLTKEIITAHIARTPVSSEELPGLIRQVNNALREISTVAASDVGTQAGARPATARQAAPAPQQAASAPVTAAAARQQPAVPINKSVTPDAIICLEDGKPFKMLKRYLRAQYNMTPEQYKAKWGLPDDYPMVAPNYSAEKSSYAKHVGLGTEKLGRPNQPAAKKKRVRA